MSVLLPGPGICLLAQLPQAQPSERLFLAASVPSLVASDYSAFSLPKVASQVQGPSSFVSAWSQPFSSKAMSW